jgi:hypothetical protein
MVCTVIFVMMGWTMMVGVPGHHGHHQIERIMVQTMVVCTTIFVMMGWTMMVGVPDYHGHHQIERIMVQTTA